MSSTASKRDRRVYRTRVRLTEALIALTLERGYETLSIRDITERAGVGYATFFRHYPDKDALLAGVLETFLEELLALVLPLEPQVDPARTGTLVFEHAQRNSELYRVLLSSRGSSDLLPRVFEIGIQGILKLRRPKAGALVPPEAAAHHIIASFVALIQWWLERGMPHPPAKMGEIYRELIMRPAQELAFED